MKWKPIETAPKDEAVLILIPRLDGWLVEIGKWHLYENEEEGGYWGCPSAVWQEYERPHYWTELPTLPVLPKMPPNRSD